MKISVNTFRANMGDCTNGGVSSKINDFILVREHHTSDYANHSTEERASILVLTDGPYNTLRAVPLDLFEGTEWYMFGGNFVYTSDSRFPSDQPIKIFDRVER